jgi:hypothetical protein
MPNGAGQLPRRYTFVSVAAVSPDGHPVRYSRVAEVTKSAAAAARLKACFKS